MSVPRENADSDQSDASDVTASGEQRSTIAGAGEEQKMESQKTETLGILLVHGIGSQRRGDTLVQCATALHSWIRHWLARRRYRWDVDIDLVDVSMAEAGPDHPAQARIKFQQSKMEGGSFRHASKFSWLIAESYWFDNYRRPGFYEFMRWALLVLPIAIMVHFMPSYHRVFWALLAWGTVYSTRKLSWAHYDAIKRQLGRLGADKTPEDLVEPSFLNRYVWKLLGQLLLMQMQLTLAALASLVVQLVLIVVGVLTIVPGITRSVAGWVQRKVSGTIGDSYMFGVFVDSCG